MKKSLLLTLLPLAFLVAACGGGDSSGSASAASSTSKASSGETTQATTSQTTSESTSEDTSADTSDDSSAASGTAIEVYLKNNGASVAWWLDAEAVTYAYVWNGTGDSASGQAFVNATYNETYDEGKTLYYTVNVETLPEHLLLIRCNPEEVATLPTSWPEGEGKVWNQSHDGDVQQKKDDQDQPIEGSYYVDLTVR